MTEARAKYNTANSGEDIWETALGELQHKMTKPTFEMHYLHSTARLDGNTLCIRATPFSIEWLRERHLPIIREAVNGIAGRAVEITFADDVTADDLQAELITAEPVYAADRNALIKPERIYPLTFYFRTQWEPRLGPILAWFVIALRQKAFWDKRTGEKRDEFDWHYEDAARQIGVSEDILWRQRKKLCTECLPSHPILEHFIIAEIPLYRYSERLGKRIRYGTHFKVMIDEPLTPPDGKMLRSRPSPLEQAIVDPPTPRQRE